MLGRLVIGLLLVLAGCLGSNLTSGSLAKWDRRAEWPTTTGTVSRSELLYERGFDDDIIIEVEFTYAVAGKRYSQKQNWVVGEPGDTGHASEDRKKYAQGAAVRVYYDPANHQMAVVEPRLPQHGWESYEYAFRGLIAVIPVLGLFVGGIALVWSGLKGWKNGANLIPDWLTRKPGPKLTEAEKQSICDELRDKQAEQEAWADCEIQPLMERVNHRCLADAGEIDTCANSARFYSADPMDYRVEWSLAWGRRWIGPGTVGGYLAWVELTCDGMVSVRPHKGEPVVSVSQTEPDWARRVEGALEGLVANPSQCAWQART